MDFLRPLLLVSACVAATQVSAQDATFNGLLNRVQCSITSEQFCEGGYCSQDIGPNARSGPLVMFDLTTLEAFDGQNTSPFEVTGISEARINAPLWVRGEFELQETKWRTTISIRPVYGTMEVAVAMVAHVPDTDGEVVRAGTCF